MTAFISSSSGPHARNARPCVVTRRIRQVHQGGRLNGTRDDDVVRRMGAVCETVGFSRSGIRRARIWLGSDCQDWLCVADLSRIEIKAAPRPALPAPGSALARPARRARAVRLGSFLQISRAHPRADWCSGQPSTSLSIIRLAPAASMAPSGRRDAIGCAGRWPRGHSPRIGACEETGKNGRQGLGSFARGSINLGMIRKV